eukprot:m.20943 g.20943  ORF g.20943 m.20943 type:complete len:59 (+) comp8992_c0_seq1:1897-2073(+)
MGNVVVEMTAFISVLLLLLLSLYFVGGERFPSLPFLPSRSPSPSSYVVSNAFFLPPPA